MQNFSVDGVPQNVWGVRLFECETEFTIGQSPKIWGNFSKIGIKLIKICKIIGEIRENANFLERFFKFSEREYFIYTKNKELIWEGYSRGFGGGEPPKVENFSRNLSKSVMEN